VPGRIERVLVTHTHVDHSPGALLLAEATGAAVLGRVARFPAGQDTTFRPSRELEHGERLLLGPNTTLRVIHTPGHASNHLCFLLEEEKLLFTGDHVMQGSTVIIDPPDGDMRAYLQSLAALLERDIAIIAPGHGYLIGSPQRELRRLIAHRQWREAKVLDALRQHDGATCHELVPMVYADTPVRLHAVAARSLLAHLVKLAAEGRASEREERYFAAAPGVSFGGTPMTLTPEPRDTSIA